MQSTMLQASSMDDLNVDISAVNPRTPTGLLTPVDTSAPLDVTYTGLGVAAYNYRDQELLYRDLIVASYVAQLGLQISTVWNCQIDNISIPAIPVSEFDYRLADLPSETSPSTPGEVDHVENSQYPAAAINTDSQLYGRDAIILECIARLSFIFPIADRIVDPLDYSITVDNTWSRAKASPEFDDISVSSPYARDTFFSPDRYLASRDNAVAYRVTQLNQFLVNIFEGADRISLRINSTPTTYTPPIPPAPPSPT